MMYTLNIYIYIYIPIDRIGIDTIKNKRIKENANNTQQPIYV